MKKRAGLQQLLTADNPALIWVALLTEQLLPCASLSTFVSIPSAGVHAFLFFSPLLLNFLLLPLLTRMLGSWA